MAALGFGKSPGGGDAVQIAGHEIPVSMLAVLATAAGAVLVLRARSSHSNVVAVGSAPAATVPSGYDPNAGAIGQLDKAFQDSYNSIEQQLADLAAQVGTGAAPAPAPVPAAEPAPSPVAATPHPAPPAPVVPVPAPAPPAPRTYTVQHGDSLWQIAQRLWGNGNAWPTLYAANQGVIGGNPNLIYPGQVLAIP